MSPFTNPFFTNTTGYTGEMSLVDDLVREQIKMFGIDLLYLPRRMMNLDKLLHESTKNAFELALPMPFYVKSFDGYDNSMEMLSKFGVRSSDEITLTCSRSEFITYYTPYLKSYYNDIAGRPLTDDLERLDGETEFRPKEGDLIYFPFDDGIFEIKYVQFDVPFFQLGKNYTFDLQCERFEYSGENFVTGYEEVDDSTVEPDYYQMEFNAEVTPYSFDNREDNTFIRKERVVLYNTIKCDYNHIHGGDAFWVQIKNNWDSMDAYVTDSEVDIIDLFVEGGTATTETIFKDDGGRAKEQPQYMYFVNGGHAIAVPTEPDVDGGHAVARYGYCDLDGFRLYKDAGYVHKVEKVEATVEYWDKPNGILTVGDLSDLDPEQTDLYRDLIINKFDNCLIIGKTSGAVWFSTKAHTRPKAFDDGELIQTEFDAIKIIDEPGDVNPFGFV